MAWGSYNLLVVDFDSFFEYNPMWDWAHNESLFMREAIWGFRASDLLARKDQLPMLTGEQETFWQRVTLAENARLWYADSNSHAVNTRLTHPRGYSQARPEQVWLFDAHHDSGYGGADPQTVAIGCAYSCEDWMIWYAGAGSAEMHVRYPRWHDHWSDDAKGASLRHWRGWHASQDDGSVPPVEFDRVFVCRSGAWVPPWLDSEFTKFIKAAPVPRRRKICLEPDGRLPEREWDLDKAQADAKFQRRVLLAMKAGQDITEITKAFEELAKVEA